MIYLFDYELFYPIKKANLGSTFKILNIYFEFSKNLMMAPQR